MINTNGLELLRRESLAAELAAAKAATWNCTCNSTAWTRKATGALRGADLLAQKQAVIEKIVDHDLPTTLVCTLAKGVNEDQVGPLVRLALAAPQLRGITFQPATWAGRFDRSCDPMNRITLADVVRPDRRAERGHVAGRRLQAAAVLQPQLLQLHVCGRGGPMARPCRCPA